MAGDNLETLPRDQTASQSLAEIDYRGGYPQLVEAFRARAAARRIAITGADVARVGGIAEYYLAKLLSPKPVKRIGLISLSPVLAVLGVKLIMVEDSEALKTYGARIPARNELCVHAGTVNIVLSRRHLRAIQRKGGRNSRLYMSKRQASALARKAVKARWAKRKQNGHGAASPVKEIES